MRLLEERVAGAEEELLVLEADKEATHGRVRDIVLQVETKEVDQEAQISAFFVEEELLSQESHQWTTQLMSYLQCEAEACGRAVTQSEVFLQSNQVRLRVNQLTCDPASCTLEEMRIFGIGSPLVIRCHAVRAALNRRTEPTVADFLFQSASKERSAWDSRLSFYRQAIVKLEEERGLTEPKGFLSRLPAYKAAVGVLSQDMKRRHLSRARQSELNTRTARVHAVRATRTRQLQEAESQREAELEARLAKEAKERLAKQEKGGRIVARKVVIASYQQQRQ
jgi:hypothetical protein